MRPSDQDLTGADTLIHKPSAFDLRAKLKRPLSGDRLLSRSPLQDMRHSVAVLPSELPPSDNDRPLHRSNMKNSAGKLSGRERHALHLACISRTTVHRDDD